MIKAKEVSLKNLFVVAMFSVVLAAGVFISKSHVAPATTMPVFAGEEIRVERVAPAVAVETKTAVKTISLPAPVPSQVAPLPIVPPSVTLKVLPIYPKAALAQGSQGTILLSVLIGLNGQPEKIETRTSSGIAELDDAAVKAVSEWRFSPATQAGQALASWFEVPVRFEVQ